MLAEKSDSGLTLILYSCLHALNLNMGIEFEIPEAAHLAEVGYLNEIGETEMDKIGYISAALLVLAKLKTYCNQRKEVLQKVATILVKLVNFSRETQSFKDILTCLTIILIRSFIVDLGSVTEGGESLQNLRDLLAFLFEILNDENVHSSVSEPL